MTLWKFLGGFRFLVFSVLGGLSPGVSAHQRSTVNPSSCGVMKGIGADNPKPYRV